MGRKLYGQDPSNVIITGGQISGVTVTNVSQDHNELDDIQGGDSTSSERYHLTEPEHTAAISMQHRVNFNQLLNTGFDRWTNSGLTQGTGSGRQTDFNVTNIFTDTDGSSAGSWVGTDCNITDGGAYLLMTQTGGTTQYAKYTLSGLTVGKRYKFVCTLANGTHTLAWNDKIRVEQNGGTHIRSCRTPAANTFSILWEAVGATDKIVIVMNLGAGETVQISNVYVDECHHGCVDADTYAADTHTKTTTLDCFREWNVSSANTYGYGKYLLKLVKGDNGAEYYNFDTIAGDYRDGQGKKAVFGCYVYSVQDNNIKLSAHDGVTEIALSSTYCPAGEITWMEITGTIAANATKLQARILCDGAAGDVAYISEPIAMLGVYIGAGNYRLGSILSLPGAQLSSDQSQTTANTGITYPITFNGNDFIYGLVHSIVTDTSRIKMTTSGTYEIIFSAIVDANTPSQYMEIWLEVDGAIVTASNTRVQIASASVEMIVSVSFLATFTENQYFELVMWGSNANNRLVSTVANAGPPARPASPSIIMTIKKLY